MEFEEKEPIKRTKKNVVFNLANQILILVIPLILTPYLARVLHEEGNGQYAYSFSIITYFIIFANLGFDIYGQRKIAAYQDNKEITSRAFWEILILKIIFSSISFLIICIILLTFGFGKSYDLLILLLSIQVISVPFDIQFLFKGKEQFSAIFLRTFIIKIVSTICIFLFVKTIDDLWKYVLFLSLSTFLSNIIMWISIKKYICFVPIKDLELKRHLKPAISIFLPSLIYTLYSIFDRTMIGLLINNADYENGCYEQAFKINNVILLFVIVLSPVLVSRNANEYKKKGIDSIKNNLYFSANYIWLISLPLIVGVNVLAGNISAWFLGDGYEKVPMLLQIMSIRLVTAGFTSALGGELFIAIGKEQYFTLSTIIALVVNIVLNLILIPYYGAVGAAATTAFSEIVMMAILCFIVQKGKYISLLKIFKLSWKYIIASIIMFFPIYFINSAMNYSILSFIICTICGAITYYIVLVVLRDKFVLSISKKIISKVLKKEKSYE